jgi:hypothetical protein
MVVAKSQLAVEVEGHEALGALQFSSGNPIAVHCQYQVFTVFGIGAPLSGSANGFVGSLVRGVPIIHMLGVIGSQAAACGFGAVHVISGIGLPPPLHPHT